MKRRHRSNTNHSDTIALRSVDPNRKDAMKHLLCRAGRALRSVACYELEKKYELSLALYPDAAATASECHHTFSGTSRHPLWKLAGLWGSVAVSVALIGSVCALLRMGRK